MSRRNEEQSVLKTILIVIGAVVSIAAILAGAYYLFKKYFKITFECDDCDECDCNGCFVDDEDDGYEPLCDEEEPEEKPADPESFDAE